MTVSYVFLPAPKQEPSQFSFQAEFSKIAIAKIFGFTYTAAAADFLRRHY
jgi:hypothetical protein